MSQHLDMIAARAKSAQATALAAGIAEPSQATREYAIEVGERLRIARARRLKKEGKGKSAAISEMSTDELVETILGRTEPPSSTPNTMPARPANSAAGDLDVMAGLGGDTMAMIGDMPAGETALDNALAAMLEDDGELADGQHEADPLDFLASEEPRKPAAANAAASAATNLKVEPAQDPGPARASSSPMSQELATLLREIQGE